MDFPTPTELRGRSALLRERFPDPAGNAALTLLSADAGIMVGSLTCRSIPTAAPGEAVPVYLTDLAVRCIALYAEKITAAGGTSKARLKALKSGNLRSVTAGPWSEAYFDKDAAAKARMLDPDPALSDALWALCTQDCRDSWLALWTGVQAPAAAAQPIAWGARGRRY